MRPMLSLISPVPPAQSDRNRCRSSADIDSDAQLLGFIAGRLEGLAATTRYEIPEPLRLELKELGHLAKQRTDK